MVFLYRDSVFPVVNGFQLWNWLKSKPEKNSVIFLGAAAFNKLAFYPSWTPVLDCAVFVMEAYYFVCRNIVIYYFHSCQRVRFLWLPLWPPHLKLCHLASITQDFYHSLCYKGSLFWNSISYDVLHHWITSEILRSGAAPFPWMLLIVLVKKESVS